MVDSGTTLDIIDDSCRARVGLQLDEHQPKTEMSMANAAVVKSRGLCPSTSIRLGNQFNKLQKRYFYKSHEKLGIISWLLFHFIWKIYSHISEILTQKSCIGFSSLATLHLGPNHVFR